MIRNEKQLIEELECSDLCFMRYKVKDLAEEKIRDCGCRC